VTRAEIKALAWLALWLALVTVRIVAAQETPAAPVACPQADAVVNRVAPSGGDSGRSDDATALVLGIAFVAEAGWDAADDHAAIAHVLQRGADRAGVSLRDYAVRYVSLLRVRDGQHVVQTRRAEWVRDLRLDARQPRGWPSHLSWSAHVPRWLAAIERARAFLRGELPDPCAGQAVRHWGGAMDRPRGGMVLARCSARTRNDFYAVGER